MTHSDYTPGGDAKAIAEIARNRFGGFEPMFEHHDWPERGSDMIRKVQARVAEVYGSVKKFEECFRTSRDRGSSIWDEVGCAYLTSFWGWTPDTWGTVGFTLPGRRDTIIRETSDPFIMVVYVTKNAGSPDKLDGKITGFYVVSHIEGDRDEFTDALHHGRDVNKWRYSLKALRAFSFVPEYCLNIDQFDPTLKSRARAVAAYSERLEHEQIKKLRAISYSEVPVYGGPDFIVSDITVPDAARNMVKAGPTNRAGYWVPGEPLETEKELYSLELTGDAGAFLGAAASGRRIYKIGLSLSPKTRLEAFRKTLPRGAFKWNLHRSTRSDGHSPYPRFEAAVAGEDAMKKSLAKSGTWLGGEFYAATAEQMTNAWNAGREAALALVPSL